MRGTGVVCGTSQPEPRPFHPPGPTKEAIQTGHSLPGDTTGNPSPGDTTNRGNGQPQGSRCDLAGCPNVWDCGFPQRSHQRRGRRGGRRTSPATRAEPARRTPAQIRPEAASPFGSGAGIPSSFPFPDTPHARCSPAILRVSAGRASKSPFRHGNCRQLETDTLPASVQFGGGQC